MRGKGGLEVCEEWEIGMDPSGMNEENDEY